MMLAEGFEGCYYHLLTCEHRYCPSRSVDDNRACQICYKVPRNDPAEKHEAFWGPESQQSFCHLL